MEKTLEIINKMKKEGLFSSYAIGGGIAALFYIEPITTFDLDIFIILPEGTKKIISLAPIYSWLKQQGYKPDNEQVMIEGIPVQLIPTYNDLIKEGNNKEPNEILPNIFKKPRLEILLIIQLHRLLLRNLRHRSLCPAILAHTIKFFINIHPSLFLLP